VAWCTSVEWCSSSVQEQQVAWCCLVHTALTAGEWVLWGWERLCWSFSDDAMHSIGLGQTVTVWAC
jgi:hypothetical protein